MQADHFMHSRENQILSISDNMITKPIILCPYDSELYGHWWYEGPHFIYSLFKKIYYENIFSYFHKIVIVFLFNSTVKNNNATVY